VSRVRTFDFNNSSGELMPLLISRRDHRIDLHRSASADKEPRVYGAVTLNESRNFFTLPGSLPAAGKTINWYPRRFMKYALAVAWLKLHDGL
jgi:hypothetical protein